MGYPYERTPRTAYETLSEVEKARSQVATHAQLEAKRIEQTAALKAQAAQLSQRGALASSLPTIGDRMSPADIATAQAKLNEAKGMSPTAARDPRNIAAARPFPAPAGSPEDVAAGRAAMATIPASSPARHPSSSLPAYGLPTNPDDRALLTETRARDAAARTPEPISVPGGLTGHALRPGEKSGGADSPEGQALAAAVNRANAAAQPAPAVAVGSDAASAATIAQAGTGNVVQTPYGTASSRPGTWLDALNDKHGQDWQQKVVALHPEIGVAGTPENTAFVEAMRGLREKADPFAIAKMQYPAAATASPMVADAAAPPPAPLPVPAAATAAPPQASVAAYDGPKLPVPAAATAAPPQGAPASSPMAPLPAPAAATAPPPQSDPAALPKLSYNGLTQDPDIQAFAQNPQDDQFMKAKREPRQLSYA